MTAAVAGTFDTKSAELSYIAGLLRAAGIETRTIDLSTGPQASFGQKYSGGAGAAPP